MTTAEGLIRPLLITLEAGRSTVRLLVRALHRQTLADPAALDAQQDVAYRIARLVAGLQAADAQSEALKAEAAAGRESELSRLFALRYGGDLLALLRAELPLLAEAMPEAREHCVDFANDPDLPALIHACTAGKALDALAVAVVDEAQDGREAGILLSEEHRLLRESFRSFAERKVRPIAEALHREDGLIPDALLHEAAELGCFGLSIPARHGGVADEPDSLGMVVVTEELSRGALIVGSVVTRPEILAKALLKGGTPAQQQRWLPVMASGAQMVAISVTEPDAGSDVARVALQARETAGGWSLNGTKVWCTFAGRAELIGLLARTDPDPAAGHRGLSMFVLEKPASAGHDFTHESPLGGHLTGRAIATLGYRGMHSYELNFEDYVLPRESLVGEGDGLGRGFYLQMEGFAYGRLQTAGRALGLMQAAFEAGRDYAASRRVFGQTLASLPLTRVRLTGMAATLHACRLAAYATARQLDAGAGQMEASLVKFLACRAAEQITRDAQQLHGGMGYAEEFAVSRYFVDARVLSIFEGTEEVLALKVIIPGLLKAMAAEG